GRAGSAVAAGQGTGAAGLIASAGHVPRSGLQPFPRRLHPNGYPNPWSPPMRRLALAALLFAPFAVFASPCKFEAPRNLQLDLAGVKSVQIDVHSQDLHLVG